MGRGILLLGTCFSLLLFIVQPSSAATLCVWTNSPYPGAPFNDWTNAAHDIQTAVDAAVDGDTVWVTNGVYQSGGRAVHGTMTNRVAITNHITVQSVNGPAVTFIVGAPCPTNNSLGNGAIRGVVMFTNSTLSGFTVTNGHTLGSTPWYEAGGGGIFCQGTNAAISNCVLTGNFAYYGGGCAGGVLRNCLITGNRSFLDGGGVDNYGVLYDCTVSGNYAGRYGGGSSYCTLYSCAVLDNIGGVGGVYKGAAYFSTIMYNNGGAAYQCTIQNSISYYNRVSRVPGQDNGNLNGSYNYSCTTPMPVAGTGNFTNEPAVVGVRDPHILPMSPCVDHGNGGALYTALDVDGEPRTNGVAVDVGCDEVWDNMLTGALQVAILTEATNVVVGFPLAFISDTRGRAQGFCWSASDGFGETNRLMVSHAFAAAGSWEVVLTASNLSGSAAATVTVSVTDGFTNYVVESGAPVAPFITWGTAATSIQDAVDACAYGGVVLVSNGVYRCGGRVFENEDSTNRVVIAKPVSVQSVHGPAVTLIEGRAALVGGNGTGAVRCVYMLDGSRLSGFTLTNGHTHLQGSWPRDSGGGAFCATSNAILSNCVFDANAAQIEGGGVRGGTVYNSDFRRNSAYQGAAAAYANLWRCCLSNNTASFGGGAAYFGNLFNCMVAGNTASSRGGGGQSANFYDCTLLNNWSVSGGGLYGGTAVNSVVYFNSGGGNFYPGDNSYFLYSCTTPTPSGWGYITNDPLFTGYGAGDYHLLSNSPCIDAGSNLTFVVNDLEAIARPLDGNNDGTNRSDMGAYEYVHPLADTDHDGMRDSWEVPHSLNPVVDDADQDADGDWMSNVKEYWTDTDPQNSASFLGLTQIVRQAGAAGIVVRWRSSADKFYRLDRSTNPVNDAFTTKVATNIAATAPQNVYTDTTAVGVGPWMYRIELE